MLATMVLLAGCVHDTDETSFFLTESGASLSYYIGSGEGTDQKGRDDSRDTIRDKFDNERGYVSKRGDHDDPWDTIADKFGDDSIHTSKRYGGDDPWDTITEKGGEAGKPFSAERSRAVFVAFEADVPASGYAKVTEVRGEVLKVVFLDGREQYVVYAPGDWKVGTEIVSVFRGVATKKFWPLLGVREWRVVSGTAAWRPVFPDTVGGELVWPDPWDTIGEQ